MVLQSFRTPRPTSNPYLAALLESLPAGGERGVDVRTFSWRTALLGRYDVLHVHWPELLLRSHRRGGRAARAAATGLLLARLALRRTPLVRTVHNPSPHEDGGRLERFLLARLDAATTVTVHLSARTVGTVCPGSTAVVVPHGHYRGQYAGHEHRAPVPGRLVHPGLLRPYKQVEALLAAFTALPGEHSLHVLGAAPDAALAGRVRAAAAGDDRVRADLHHVGDAELVRAVTAAELVVLPYAPRGGSGAQLLALSLDRPVLLPAGPAAAELAAEVGPGWVHTFTGPLSPAHLQAALAAVRADARTGTRADHPDLSARGWDVVGRAHADVYHRAVGRAAGDHRAHHARPVGAGVGGA
ncbi:glycosyl transferase [Kineococcus sp. LSe6-4]|uniref:Glycosyl transferase n=1 Tax=Kineococcus halophytocola TaxID=3234027 RepID=A0ABV4GYG2_9ACTN